MTQGAWIENGKIDNYFDTISSQKTGMQSVNIL